MNVRPDQPNRRRARAPIPGALVSGGDSRNIAWRPFTILIVALFWVGQFGANALYTKINAPQISTATLLPRTIVCSTGALITLACIAIQDRSRGSRLAVRAYWAAGFTIVSAAILGAWSYFVYGAFMPMHGSTFWAYYPLELMPRLWVFGSVYGMSLAISYSTDVREREQEIAALRGLAQDAQLRALRSQLNPHFLFNALNSIAALIGEGRALQAEQTTEHLADFLRITLSLDPQRLITLSEEASLQRIYLEMQKTRFPTRLDVAFDIAPEVEKALVPNLILQPLIENSIKHAVAQSTAPVTVRIQARADRHKLRVIVADDGGNAAAAGGADGSKIGLANVAERLDAHFGEEATLSFGQRDGGGFRNVMLIPLRWAS